MRNFSILTEKETRRLKSRHITRGAQGGLGRDPSTGSDDPSATGSLDAARGHTKGARVELGRGSRCDDARPVTPSTLGQTDAADKR